MPSPTLYRLALGTFALFSLLPASLQADWQRTDVSLAWKAGDTIVWRFNFDATASGKPFFHPLGPVGGAVLTNQ